MKLKLGILRWFAKINPSIDNLARLMVYLHKSGQTYEALVLCDRILKVYPKNDCALVHKGNIMLEWNRIPEARNCFSRAINECPKDTYARFGLGRVKMSLGIFEEAIEEFYKAIRYKYPGSYLPLADISCCYYFLGDFEKARKAVSQALEVCPEYGFAKDLLSEIDGRIQMGVQRYLADLTEIEYALPFLEIGASREIPPGLTTLYLALYKSMQSKDVKLIDEAIAKVSGHQPEHILLNFSGVARFDIGLKQEGLKLIRKSVEIDNNSHNSLVLASRLREIPEYIQEAKRIYSELLKNEPDNPLLLSYLAGLEDEAEDILAIYAKICSFDCLDDLVHFIIGKALQKVGRFDDAIKAFNRAYELSEDNPGDISLGIAQCHFAKQDLNKAKVTVDRAIYEQPDLTEADELLNKINDASSK